MLRVLSCLIVLVAATAACAADAAGAVRLGKEEVVARALPGRVEADGVRYAAWTAGRTLHVRDDAQGLAATVELPECGLGRWDLLAVGGGLALVACGEPAFLGDERTTVPQARLVGLASGTQWDARAALEFLPSPGADESYRYRIGTQWIEVAMRSYHGSHEWYANWRTGEMREDPVTGPVDQAVDLNRPELLAPLCSPVRRTVRPGDMRAGARWRPVLRSSGAVVLTSDIWDAGTIQLHRCSSAKPIALGTASQVVVADGRAWLAGSGAPASGVVETVTLGARKRTSLRFSGSRIAVTRAALYGTRLDPDGYAIVRAAIRR